MEPDRPLRVCLLIAQYPPRFSGMAIQVQRSLPFLRARGVEMTILTWRLPPSLEAGLLQETGTIDRVLAPGTGRIATIRRVAQLRRYFESRSGAFDVLHSDVLGWEFLLNVRRIKALGLPVIMEMVLLDGDDPLALSREDLGALKLRLLKQVDIWIGISGAFRSRALEAGISGERFRLVYPGVDVETYRPLAADERRATRVRLGLPADSRIVVSVGAVIRRKGVDRLLEAWMRIAPVRDRDLLLIVGPASVGEGLSEADMPFVKMIRDATGAPALKGTVRLIGRAENVHDYLGAADLFLFLSRQEGLPIVSVEALAAGLPFVVSPLEGIDEVVQEGETGFIVRDPDDADAVSALVSRLLDQPRERAAMGAQARRHALARFSFDARADALSALYRELAARSHAPSGQ